MDVGYVFNNNALRVLYGGFWVDNMDAIKEKDILEDRFKKPTDFLNIILDNSHMVGQVGVFEGIRLLKCNLFLMEIMDEDDDIIIPKEPDFNSIRRSFERDHKLKLPNQLDINSKEYDILINYQAQEYRDLLFMAQTKMMRKLKLKKIIDLGKYSKPPVPL